MRYTLNDKYSRHDSCNTILMQPNREQKAMDIGNIIRITDYRKRKNDPIKHLILNYFKPDDFRYGNTNSTYSSLLFDQLKLIEQYKRANLNHYTVEDIAARIFLTFTSQSNKGLYSVPSVVYIVEPVAPEHEGTMEKVGIANMHFILSKVQIQEQGYFIENIFKIEWSEKGTTEQINQIRDKVKTKAIPPHNQPIKNPKEWKNLQAKFQSCTIQPPPRNKKKGSQKANYIWFGKEIEPELRTLLGGELVCLDFPIGELLTLNACTGRKYSYRPYVRGIDKGYVSMTDQILPLDMNNPEILDNKIRSQTAIHPLKWEELLPHGKTIADEIINGRQWMHLNLFAWTDYWGARFVFGENSKGETISHIFL